MRIKKRVAIYMASTVGAASIVIPGAIILGGQGGTAAIAAPNHRVAVVHLSHDPMHAQANALTGKRLTLGVNASPHKVAVFSDGCNHAYGLPTQCIPLRAPGNQPMTCAYLAKAGFLTNGLVVRKDPLGLLRVGEYRTTKTGTLLTHC